MLVWAAYQIRAAPMARSSESRESVTS